MTAGRSRLDKDYTLLSLIVCRSLTSFRNFQNPPPAKSYEKCSTHSFVYMYCLSVSVDIHISYVYVYIYIYGEIVPTYGRMDETLHHSGASICGKS